MMPPHKPFLAYISSLWENLETYLGTERQRSEAGSRFRQDIVVISAAMLVVLALYFLAAYLITRF
jgi:flagellar biogenesis protein FliO